MNANLTATHACPADAALQAWGIRLEDVSVPVRACPADAAHFTLPGRPAPQNRVDSGKPHSTESSAL